MKIFLINIFFMLAMMSAIAQNGYTITTDPKHPEKKMLVGAITKAQIAADTAFDWYASSFKYYTPDSSTLNKFKLNKHFKFMVFGGTWCEDTQTILPKFFKLLELSDFPIDNVSLFAVDREKKVFGNITAALNVNNVPTIIVLKEGKEVGRVVEYGTTGNWDKELAAFLQ
jgi:thiol-disulfide isomerase/thioredoxin